MRIGKRTGHVTGRRGSPAGTIRAIPTLVILTLTLLQVHRISLADPDRHPTGNDPSVFYGYAPPTIFNYTMLVNQTVVANYTRFQSRLDIVGINDSTRVEVYNLTDRTMIASKTISRMELWTLYLGSRASGTGIPSGGETYLKIVSDRPVAALLSGGDDLYRSTFYPSTDGGFSGKEFIFKAVNGTHEPVIYVWDWDVGFIIGVEDSHVAVYNATSKITELDVPSNSFKKVTLRSGAVYRVSSTGRIMIISTSSDSFDYMPAATGGFVGRVFYGTTASVGGWEVWYGTYQSVMAIANEECEAKLYDTRRPGLSIVFSGPDARKSLRAGENWFDTSTKASTPLRVEGTGDMSALMGRGAYGWGGTAVPAIPEHMGDDIAFAGARAGQTFHFYAPTQAIIFAPQDAEVEIDGVATTMRRDEWQIVLAGFHVLRANTTIIVEVLGYGVDRFYNSWASYMVSEQGLGVTYPAPAPIGGLGELTPVIAVVVGVPAAVLAILFVRRRRARPQ